MFKGACHICHFFTLTHFLSGKFFTQKCVWNYTLCVELHIVCEDTHNVQNTCEKDKSVFYLELIQAS